MAIKVSETRYGTRYLALYRNVDGKQKSAGTFSTRREAEAAYMEAKAKVLRGIDPALPVREVAPLSPGGGMTVAQWADEWFPRHELSGNARISYGYKLTNYILPKFGQRPIASIATHEIAAWLREMGKDGRHARTMKVKAVMSAMFRGALRTRAPECRSTRYRESSSEGTPGNGGSRSATTSTPSS